MTRVMSLVTGLVLATSCVREGKQVGSEAGDDATSDPTSTSTSTSDPTSTSDSTSTSTADEDSGSTSSGDGDPEPACGDGQLDAGEECDDGNLDDSDGCSIACETTPSCAGQFFCDATPESCPLAAQVNADIQGMTPLGPFSGTFAAISGALAFGELGTMVILPEYIDGDLCGSSPQLILTLAEVQQVAMYMFEAPVRYDDGQGNFVDSIAAVTVHECCNLLDSCWCENPNPYWIDVLIEGEGWSLFGTAAPNCCRSHSMDEGA
jgi:cysteine-rich repeat protein